MLRISGPGLCGPEPWIGVWAVPEQDAGDDGFDVGCDTACVGVCAGYAEDLQDGFVELWGSVCYFGVGGDESGVA